MNATAQATIASAWAHPRLAAQVTRPRRDGAAEVALRVEGLAGARQVLLLEQLLHGLPGVRRVAIDARAQRVRVVWDPAQCPLPRLLAAFAGARCEAVPLRRENIDDARSGEAHDALKRLLVAGMCAMQVMSYALVLYLGVVDFIDFTTRGLFRWLSLLTTLPVVFYAAAPFFAGAWRELAARRPGVNLPIALATALVFAASALATLRGHGEIYFDSISMFIFLLLGARYVELRARHRSGSLGDAALDAAPLLAERRGADGRLETVPALELLPGDRIRVAEGATVPADGILDSPQAELDEALLSGESRPVCRHRGERLAAGSVLLGTAIELTVEHGGDDTALARLGALASRAREIRGTHAGSDREITRFVLRVLALTAVTGAGWLLVDPARAFDAAVAVLVVACPCAFALTEPAALTRALGVLARRGVLVAEPMALRTLADVDFALFDKTGTLTRPRLDVSAIETTPGESADAALRLAAALATASSHPLARAVSQACDDLPPEAHDVAVVAGAGLTGTVEGRGLRLGRADFAAPGGQPPDAGDDGALVLADAKDVLARFSVGETPRGDAAAAVAELQADGIEVALASGDEAGRVRALADTLAIGRWQARQAPADKLAMLAAARERGRITLAVGDGSNDAPVLAGADVSVALASGTDLAQAHADLLLTDDRLAGLVDARRLARHLARVVAQGRRGSLVYNLIAVPFAAFGLVPPWLAAIGMSLSSLAVVLNALRVGRRVGPVLPA